MPDKTTTLNLNKPLGSEVVDIDVLNENMDILDTTVKDVQDFMTQTEADLASAEARITALDNAATGIAAEERKRVTAESGRVTAEDTRIANETGRVSAEQARVSAENQRADAETARAAAEANRVSAETAREQVIEDFVDTTDANKKDAEAYAVGTRGGTDVPDTDPTYHNNAKYYAGQASADAEAADAAKTTAVSTVESAIGNIRTEGTTQVSAVQTKGNEVLASIPDDYEALSTDVSALKSALENVAPIVTSENLLNPDNIALGYYSTSGAYSENEAYRNSGFIPVTSGETLYFSYWTLPPYAGSGIGRGMSARFLCAFDANKTPVPESGVERVQSYTVPNGVAYIIFSWSYSTYSQYQYMVNAGDSIPAQFEPYYEYREIAEDVKLPNYSQLLSNIASAALSNTTETLLSNENFKIANAPRFVKKNVGVSFYGKFSETFAGVNVGKGYLLYRGKWLVITPTTVSVHSDTTDTTIDTQLHGLTITDYIAVNMFMGDDGILHYSINTTSGSYTNTCDIGNEFNYAPFAIAAQTMTDCKISVSYSDIKCPVWIIGDSYCGYALNRVMGNIRQLGFTNFLVDAVAGGVAYDNVVGDGDKSMIDDFLRLTAFALPKIIIWACGMNGAESMNINIIGYIVKFCADNNIDVILYKTPNVPTINHDQLNAFVMSTGKRYIDGFGAVSADNTGVWYNDFLASDNVHPTVIGAEALAQRWLVDAPELMRS